MGCGRLVHFSDLTRNASEKHGVSRYCRDCEASTRKYKYHHRGGREYQERWRRENPDRRRVIDERWRRAHPAKLREIQRQSTARRLSPVEGSLNNRIACRLRYTLAGKKHGRKSFDVLGYTVEELRAHLERQFLPGMSWDNMGKWHIDHIVPLASFSFTGPEDPEVRRAWALTNLRPLWAHDNHIKKDKREFLI